MTAQTARIAIADDHPVLLTGLSHALRENPAVTLAGAAANSTGLIKLLQTQPVDAVICDYVMPGGAHGDGMTLFRYLRRHFPQLKLIVLTVIDHVGIIHSLLGLGVNGILSKADSREDIGAAVQATLAGKMFLSPDIQRIMRMHDKVGLRNSAPDLTPREIEVIRLFVSGLKVGEIAERLHRSKQTVSTQKLSAMRKLGIQRDADLIRYGLESNLILHAAETFTELSAPPASSSES